MRFLLGFKRKKVVLGEHEPTDTECEWSEDEDADENNQAKIEEVNEIKKGMIY